MKLPPAELEVLKHVCEGRTEREIAQALQKSERTVHNQIKSIMDRLNVRNRTSAAVAAIREGLIEVDTLSLLQRE